jgi:hypothetical protein
MDIEGAEQRVLHNARENLIRYRPRLAGATEHNADDETTIAAAVRDARPDYQLECGQFGVSDKHIRPEVLYFFKREVTA